MVNRQPAVLGEAETLMPPSSVDAAHSNHSSHTLGGGVVDSEKWGSSKSGRTRPYLSARLAGVHVIHTLLLGLHIVALIAAIVGWSFGIAFSQAAYIQTGVTAVLQIAFVLIVGCVIALARSVAVDSAIRHPPSLGILHLRLQAWSGLPSSLLANWAHFRSNTPSSSLNRQSTETNGLKTIFFYLACCALVQLGSSSIFTINFSPTQTSTIFNFTSNGIVSGARFQNFDTLWTSSGNITSSDRTRFPPAAINAAHEMFAARVNDTRYPGLHGRLIHDTINLDNGITLRYPWSEARVNASLINVHCSQVNIDSVTIDTFILPRGSSDFSIAEPSPSPDGSTRFIFPDDGFETGAWINFTMRDVPPYWPDSQSSVVNFEGYWGSRFVDGGLPTKVMFPPWSFANGVGIDQNRKPIGHHQLIMVILTNNPRSLIVDSQGSIGPNNIHNFTLYRTCSNPSCQVYAQVIGCTMTSENITATISQRSQLLEPKTELFTLVGPEAQHDDHVWDEFVWEGGDNENGVDPIQRQFLLAFTPSSPYNDTSNEAVPSPEFVGEPERLIASLLKGELFHPFRSTNNANPTNANALVNFQGSMERWFASYLWNINRLCSPFDELQPYWRECGGYWDTLFGSADFSLQFPSVVLEIVLWRAVLSVIASLMMLLVGFGMLGFTVDQPRRMAPQGHGLLETARLLRKSSIPKVVGNEMEMVKMPSDPDRELLSAMMSRRLRYQGDSQVGGHLEFDS